MLPHLPGKPEVVYEDALYLASAAALLKRIRKVAAKVRHVMLIGHDPGLHALAQQLAGAGTREDLQALAEKFPTGGLAVLVFAARSLVGREARRGPSGALHGAEAPAVKSCGDLDLRCAAPLNPPHARPDR